MGITRNPARCPRRFALVFHLLDVDVTVEDRVCTSCEVRVAIPKDDTDNPWSRKGDAWRP